MRQLTILMMFLGGIALSQDDVDPATTLTSVGQVVPDFSASTTDGTIYSSSSLKGKCTSWIFSPLGAPRA